MKTLVIPVALLAGLTFSAIAAEPETEAVEFYNRTLHHYFITATASEAKLVDDGAAGTDWVRTGRSFPAWLDPANAPSNAAGVCRFYSTGANSHFYTADAGECQGLKALESTEREHARSTGAPILGWQYEGISFRVEAPVNGACPAGTTAVSRVYNNGFTNGEGSNHRFVDDSELRALMVERSWISEGVVFCSRTKPTGTNANLPPTSSSFDALVASWTGTAQWEKKSTGSRDRAPLTLDIATNGSVTGSGRGCAFSGQLRSGDGFRSLFTGALTAAGCSDASFNGTYGRFDLERYGNGTLMLEAKMGDGASEVSIEATLSTASAPVTPPATVPSPAGITGSFSGTFTADVEVRNRTSNSSTTTSSSSTAQFSVSSSGAISGTGFGCTFTGSLAPSAAVPGVSTGTVSASGCTNVALNGSYAASAHAENGALSLEMESEAESANLRTKVHIRGIAPRT